MIELIAFKKTYEIPDKDWKWLTIDEDGTITVFVNDPNDEEYQGEPTTFNSNFSGGYWANPYGPKKCWYEVAKKSKVPKEWTAELYVLEEE